MSDQARFDSNTEWRHIPQAIKDMPVPMPSFWIGLLWFAGHAHSGHPAYFNGALGRTGWWGYFPEAIALKSPIGLLAAVVLALLALVLMHPRADLRRAGPLLVALGIFLLASMAGRVDIGVRHVLPVILLLYILVTDALAHARWT